jgi:CheY-like chemotaxis protein
MKLEVLIVDDESIILKIHYSNVVRNGLHPLPESFLNGKVALDFIQKKDSPDTMFLVLLDINMPIMNGWKFLDEIQNQKLQSTVLVAIVTSSVDIADHQKAREYPSVIEYLEKPITAKSIQKLKEHPRLIDSL